MVCDNVEGRVQTVQQPTLLKTSPKKRCFVGGKTPLFPNSFRFFDAKFQWTLTPIFVVNIPG